MHPLSWWHARITNLRGLLVSLAMVVGSLRQIDGGDAFQCDCGDGKLIQCTIVDVALRDLVDFHRIKKTAADPSTVLLREVVRLANAKYHAGRLEEDGGLLIRSTDILRFGFGNRQAASDHVNSRNDQLSEALEGEGSTPDKKDRFRSLLSIVTRAAKVQSLAPNTPKAHTGLRRLTS
jgi:hypothetical protein